MPMSIGQPNWSLIEETTIVRYEEGRLAGTTGAEDTKPNDLKETVGRVYA
jgi:hypothetical protein